MLIILKIKLRLLLLAMGLVSNGWHQVPLPSEGFPAQSSYHGLKWHIPTLPAVVWHIVPEPEVDRNETP